MSAEIPTQEEFVRSGVAVLIDGKEIVCPSCTGIFYFYARLGRLGLFPNAQVILDSEQNRVIPISDKVHGYFYFCHDCGHRIEGVVFEKQ